MVSIAWYNGKDISMNLSLTDSICFVTASAIVETVPLLLRDEVFERGRWG